jgi:hypothetical protein
MVIPARILLITSSSAVISQTTRTGGSHRAGAASIPGGRLDRVRRVGRHHRHRRHQRGADRPVRPQARPRPGGLVALWSLVAALAFSGTLLTWLVFADALAVGVLALADLTAHEATTEKVVHQLVVHDGTAAEQRAAA